MAFSTFALRKWWLGISIHTTRIFLLVTGMVTEANIAVGNYWALRDLKMPKMALVLDFQHFRFP